MSQLSAVSQKETITLEKESLVFRIDRKIARLELWLLTWTPNFITNNLPPFLMMPSYLRRARSNTSKIPATLSSQAICAKHCGSCPSNPFVHTQGHLYCISGKSKKPVKERGCNCFDCEAFEICGGFGYFCKYGSADQVKENPRLAEEISKRLNKVAHAPIRNNKENESIMQKEVALARPNPTVPSLDDIYHQRFIDGLIYKKEDPLTYYSQKEDAPRETINPQKMITVTYEDTQEELSIPYGKSLLEISLANNIPHTHLCGGRAKCSTCRVLVIDGTDNLPKRNAAEEIISTRKHFPPRVRLACQSIPQGDVTIRPLVQNKKNLELAITQKRDGANFFAVDCHAAVLFADIRSFTTLSEDNLIYDTVQVLNEYFAAITKPIDRYKGYVDKYMGDGIMAIFGLEDSPYPPEEAALYAALDIFEEVRQFNTDLKNRQEHELKIGIGIDAGEIVMAKLGFDKKTQFTAIGDVVNTSSRLESQTKIQAAGILVSDNIYKVTHNKFNWGRRFSGKLKGKKTLTKAYELLKRK